MCQWIRCCECSIGLFWLDWMFCLILSSVCSHHRLLFLEFNLPRADGISLQERGETGGFHQFQLTPVITRRVVLFPGILPSRSRMMRSWINFLEMLPLLLEVFFPTFMPCFFLKSLVSPRRSPVSLRTINKFMLVLMFHVWYFESFEISRVSYESIVGFHWIIWRCSTRTVVLYTICNWFVVTCGRSSSMSCVVGVGLKNVISTVLDRHGMNKWMTSEWMYFN